MEVDAPPVPVPVPVQPKRPATALDLDLSHSTRLLLELVGLLTATTTITAPRESLFRRGLASHTTRLPLIAQDDLVLLLSATPAADLPQDLPFTVTTSSPSPRLRSSLLATLSRLALSPALTLDILALYRPIAIAIVGNWFDLLGLDHEGRWREGQAGVEQAAGEKDAVDKVWTALVTALPLMQDEITPFLRLLLRHPLLEQGPLLPDFNADPSILARALLTMHSALHQIPTLPAIASWPLPQSLENLMKAHSIRAIRLLAWRCVRAWLGLYAGQGEDLKAQWVLQRKHSTEVDEIAPMPRYPSELEEEYTSSLGPDQGEEDFLPAGTFGQELVGEARLIEGGLEVTVLEKGVDPWILPLVEDVRKREIQTKQEDLAFLQENLEEERGQNSIGRLESNEFSKTVVVVEGVLAFREGLVPSLPAPTSQQAVASVSATEATFPSTTTTQEPEPFICTPSHSDLLRSLARRLESRKPTLVTGSPSSGKQSVITHLWNLVHASPTSTSIQNKTTAAKKRGLVIINLADRSLDSKSLLGSLSSAPSSSSASSSTAGAGEFTFVEGPLTRALRQGRWTLLLNIDQAAPELLSVIKIVAERMYATQKGLSRGGIGAEEQDGGVGVRLGDGKWVKAREGFMLFATRSVPISSIATVEDQVIAPPSSFFASHFFEEVVLAPLSNEEVGQIVKGRYPELERVGGLRETLVGAWERVREVSLRQTGTKEVGGSKRDVGVRDLLRWCRRISALLPPSMSLPSLASNPTLQEEVFIESRDVFLGSLALPPQPTPSDRYSLISRTLADALSLSDERMEWALRRRVPDLVMPTIDTSSGRLPSSTSSAQQNVKIGRVALPYAPVASTSSKTASRPYALTKPSLNVLEKLAACLSLAEPVLMVGETGTGKTAAVGYLAEMMGRRLTAINLSNQTESGDLVGGFRPIDEAEEARRTASELVNVFVDLFGQTFSLSRNAEFVAAVKKAFAKKRYSRLVGLWREAARMASDRLGGFDDVNQADTASTTAQDAPRKKRKLEASTAALVQRWKHYLTLIADFDARHAQPAGQAGGKGKAKFVFSFVEGPLAKAIRSGDWVLLDEVNLASAETLESLSTLLQAPDSSLVLTEQGDLEPIPRHRDFRLFACMNPATDVGKRDLPAGLRSKFTELWVPPPDEDRDALRTIVEGYIGRVAVSERQVIADVAELYSSVKSLALRAQLADGQNLPPHFSMRTLARALSFAAEFAPTFGLRRSLYEGFVMAFTMLLDPKSQEVVKVLIDRHIVQPAKNPRSLMEKVPTKPADLEDAIRVHHYWLALGPEEPETPEDYILTPSVQSKVCDLARAVLTRKVPVLIQGPTSAGKTSVVEYLAKRTGHRFVRINNHEHTDIQEYVGTYVSDPHSGKLVFQEGVLVRALRRGDWIVLDELNLAPTDVLEALNRLLDDNRELLIPETGEVVRPHPHFMLFATQNPPGLYGGRKVLSRAFRNRFLEMHFGDVPKEELKTILERRCRIAPSHAERTVNVFLELQRRRQAGRVFEQKQAFATLRDLFRWGNRGPVEHVQQLAEDGYMLLAERARRADDKQVVKEVLEEVLKVKIDDKNLYDFARLPEIGLPVPPQNAELVWTNAMRRLYFLIAASLHRNEPVLLVGETGSGKTSVCQSLALALGRQLHIVGCHQNTETADLLGGQRPLRNRASLQASLTKEAVDLATKAHKTINVEQDFENILVSVEAQLINAGEEVDVRIQRKAKDLADRMRATTALFEWHDGPLVQAMQGGDLILLDEISLADDSVLERLNSVLEPSRTLVLAEKGGKDLSDIQITGEAGFQILATMNPGGDFGKKELSPALRNRFTEIWVPAVDDVDDLLHIVGKRWKNPQQLEPFGPKILDFAKWFAGQIGQTEGLGIGLRDILGWVDFLNAAITKSTSLDLADAFCQGALMTVVDGLGALPATSSLSKDGLERLRTSCWRYLEQAVPATMAPENLPLDVQDENGIFSIGPFGVSKGQLPPAKVDYTLLAPTTRLNAMRLLRALQLAKPVLLEGSPGVGKTSLVTAISAATGHHLVRINLSDQTDLMDLLGSDLPVEGGKSGEFAWKDAPFLAAMQNGDWVLLDEMNLASQSVLEGLNSCLDHRGQVYIPELDRTFTRHPEFRIFAAQNPLGQGGGRKGLPRSFLDRFSVVHMEELDSVDLNAIAAALYPDIDEEILRKMIAFNTRVHQLTMEARSFGMEGAPWEFNLRDVLRWLSLIRSSSGLDARRGEAIEYFGLLYLQRFRNLSDRTRVAQLFAEAFGESVNPLERPYPSFTPRFASIGHSLLSRSDATISNGRPSTSPSLLQRSFQPLEALVKCLDMGWLAILTGARGGGKSSLVRQVSALAGRRLREFSMNAEVDTLELLGSFEQADRLREISDVLDDALDLLLTSTAAQLASPSTDDIHLAVHDLHKLQVVLNAGQSGLTVPEIASTIKHALDISTGTDAASKEQLAQRIEAAVETANSTSAAARFEWIDGPLVRAMKNGDWLLIEDANLCSPSVLDRLNSLFETSGRLQLAERGPVNGEIQIIAPHPAFRLVMTLDPRNGELSRAMRNRGIEIAILPATPTSATPSSVASTASSFFAVDEYREPTFSTIARLADLSLQFTDGEQRHDDSAVAQQLVSTLSPAQYPVALRALRTFTLIESAATSFEYALRQLEHHSLVGSLVSKKRESATMREVPFNLFALQPIDSSLLPLDVALESNARAPLYNTISATLEAVAALLLAPSSRPDQSRRSASKASRSLTVWDKSILASQDKFKLEEDESNLAALFPLFSSLGQLVSKLAESELGSLTPEDREALSLSLKTIGSLALELESVSQTRELDVSTVHHVVDWVSHALAQVPETLKMLTHDAADQLAPLRSSLTLSSGKAMSAIWKATLPYKPANGSLSAAYTELRKRGLNRDQTWSKDLANLFLEIGVVLGAPQTVQNDRLELEATQLIDQLLARLPAAPTDKRDEVFALTDASNSTALLVAELATVATALSRGSSTLAADTLVKIARQASAIPFTDMVPVHQLASWPGTASKVLDAVKPSVVFATFSSWTEHLALAHIKLDETVSSADLARPVLLRKVIDLRLSETPTLVNLVKQSKALADAANLQLSVAATDRSSRVENLRVALLALISLVVCNSDDEREASLGQAQDLAQAIAARPSTPLAEAAERYLSKQIVTIDSPAASLPSIAGGFVAFSRFLWQLYVPNLPIDPAVALRAHANFIGRQLSSMAAILATVQADQVALIGNGSNAKIERVAKEVSELQRLLDQAGVAPVTREGNPALLSALFAELRSFRDQIVSDHQLDSLVDELERPWSPTAASREANLQRSVDTLLRRIEHAYAEILDIVAPIRLALCTLKIGFALLAHTAQTKATPNAHEPFRALLTNLTSFPIVAESNNVANAELPLSIKAGEAPQHPTQATLLQLAAFSTRHSTKTNWSIGSSLRLTQLYERLHHLWSTDRRHAEEEAEEAASLYKAKVDMQQVATDEELEAQEFAKLFPSYEEANQGGDHGSAAATENPATAKTPRFIQAQDELVLYKIHSALFGKAHASTAQSDLFEQLRTSAINTLVPKLYTGLDETLDRDSAVYRVHTLVELARAVDPPQGIEAPHHDFYTESNPKETAKAVPILLALVSRLSDLIAIWPDQMVLHGLRDRCNAILAFSSTSPIAQILTALEQLLQQTEDWEKYADREHSIATDRSSIISQIVEWRRFELTCWSRLLHAVEDKFEEPVANWWFRFYETTIRSAPGLEEAPSGEKEPKEETETLYWSELVKLLDSFFQSCSIGQFSARLNLVASFGRYALELGTAGDSSEGFGAIGAASLRKVSRILLNVHAFYSQFSAKITSFLTTERNKIEKDVQNLIKLASWKDINVYALRASAVRSHHQLYKSVRKLRAVLQKPASDFFTPPDAEQSGSARLVIEPVVTRENVLDRFACCSVSAIMAIPTDVDFPALPTGLTPSSKVHLAQLDQTYKRLQSLASGKLGAIVGLDAAKLLEDFSGEIISTAKSLRDEPLGEEEGREQRVKNLIERKRRAWRDLLNELKRVGVSPSPSPKTVARLEDAGQVYSLVSSQPLLALDSLALPGDVAVRLRRADAYHYRLLSELPTLRTYPASHNADVRTPDIQRALGHIQTGLALTFDQRIELIGATAKQVRLDRVITRIESISSSQICQQPVTVLPLAQDALKAVSQAVEALNESRDELSRYRSASDAPADASNLSAVVNESISTLSRDQDRLNDAIASMGDCDPLLATEEELALVSGSREHLIATVASLSSLSIAPTLVYLREPLLRFLSSISGLPSQEAAVGADLESVQAGHDNLVSSILVIAQEVLKIGNEETRVSDDGEDLADGGVLTAGRKYRNALSTLRFSEMSEQVESFALNAQRALLAPDQVPSVNALLGRIAPFLRLYSELLSRNLSAYADWHKSSLKLNHVLASILKDLATEGFCRPAEDDGKGGGDAETDGKTTEGTGMAEGTGAKNVSNEIEDESQLEGLESDVPQEKKPEDKNEEEGDDDAVEMQGDFEGEMEDRGDGEKDEKEDGDSDDEDEDEAEPEEQVADVDPLDPSSVDEKFWGDDNPAEDQEGKSDEVNQETKQQPGESEMTAKDDQAPAPQPKGEQGEDASKDEAEKEESEGKKGDEMQGEEQDGDAEADEEGGEGQEEEQEAEGDQAAQEDGQRLDERMPEADNLDLPEDMQLDGEDKDKDQGDDLDLDDDMGDLPEDNPDDGGEGENDERPDQLEEMGDSKDDGLEDEDPLAGNPELDEQQGADEDKPTEEDPSNDPSLGGADQGENGGEGEQDSAAAQPDESSAADVSKQAGAQDRADASTQQERDPANQAGEADDADDQMEDADDAPPATAPSASASGPSKQRSGADPTADPSAAPQPQDRSPAEPQRSLGDALQNWRRRLEAIGDLAQPEEPEQAETKAPDASEQEGAVEYVQDGDEQEADEQALGPANEEQVQKLEQLHIGEEQEAGGFQPDEEMNDSGAQLPPVLPEPPSTVQLQGSTLAESEAKAIPSAEVRANQDTLEEDRDMEEELERVEEDLPSSTFAPPIDEAEDAAVEQQMLQWRNGDDSSLNADGVWRLYESLTRDLSFALTEQLRLILEPTLATRLKGDYRSGKRLNMKKIIPYIASEFTKDKIWLRRTRPSQREYQVLIAIDDSKSMADSHSVHLAFQSLALITRALTRLEVGGVSICRFGETMDVLHPFEGGPVSDDAGANLLNKFTFAQRTTDVRLLVERSLAHLAQAKESARSGKSSLAAGDLWQLQIIISDGHCQDHERLRALLRQATEQKVLFVFVVIDSLHQRTNDASGTTTPTAAPESDVNQQSILAMKTVQYETGPDGRLALKLNRYIDSFPFEHFVVLRTVEGLPDILSDTLRQFFEAVSSDR
ncbi:AAA family ATPase midasin [Sporobolomyces koalae]|uniref:AAA family ATPase midasin n=1 Tax=Sporobolomyces koalae TaxID=500713 RepID=UPI0031711A4F